MSGVLAGFATIAAVIVVGIVLAHFGIVDASGQRALALIVFYVASPALLISVLSTADVGVLYSGTLVASVAAVAVVAGLSIAVCLVRGADLAETVIATMAGCYVNAGNLGLPIAAYVLGDAALVVPILMLQLLVLQPLAVTALDIAVLPVRPRLGAILRRPFTNPITVASAFGVGVAIAGVELPRVIGDPLDLLGGMSVPSMLLAYGVSLRLGPLPGRGVAPAVLSVTVALKLAVQPIVGYVVGRAIGLDATELLAVTVLAGLPSAQNVFVIANRYQRGTVLARDAVFVSTVCSVPSITLIAALLA